MAKYNDPDKAKVEQYSLDYLRSLKSSAPEVMIDLWEAGHFTAALAEEAERKAASKSYTTHITHKPQNMREFLAEREAEEAAKSGQEARKREIHDLREKLYQLQREVK
ncbi:hypothetical protein ACX6XY_10885 [Streptomyces sp. O3]